MRTKIFLILSFIYLLISNSTSTNRSNTHSLQRKTNVNKTNTIGFVKAFTLKRKDNITIGDVYVKYINDSIFTDLFIVNHSDTLYRIVKSAFFCRKKTDIRVYSNQFYGYKFAIKNKDSFTLSYYRNNCKYISDDIIIEWNYNNNILRVLKTP